MVATLGEMGFGPNRAHRALKTTGYKGVETAMEWLLTKTNDDALDDPLSETEEEMETEQTTQEESGEPKKELTEEEKREKMEKLEELRKKKRGEREEKEKKEAKAREAKRITEGKSMTEIKQMMEEQEIRKMADLRRREKVEDKVAKERILKQIEADKIARRAQFNMKTPDDAPKPAATPAPVLVTPAAKKDYTEARIQIRQTNGQPIVHTFGVKEQLAAVRLYVEMNRSDGSVGTVKLMSSFPKKVYSEEDYENSLENLGLVPTAVLMMTK